jgi:hypothetical protein
LKGARKDVGMPARKLLQSSKQVTLVAQARAMALEVERIGRMLEKFLCYHQEDLLLVLKENNKQEKGMNLRLLASPTILMAGYDLIYKANAAKETIMSPNLQRLCKAEKKFNPGFVCYFPLINSPNSILPLTFLPHFSILEK